MINKTNATVAAALMMLGTIPAHAEVSAKVYGFAKASYMYESKGFNQDAKPINVNNETGLSGDAKTLNDSARGQFTARHSRFGIDVDNGSAFKAKMEFDLDGQSDASGGNTVGVTGTAGSTADGFGSPFRFRQANITYKVNDTDTLTLGKKWEIFSPLQPHSYQMTTIQFWAGNTGFITDGIDYTHKGEVFGWAAELKNPTTNVMAASNATNNAMKVSAPVVTLRGDWKFMEGQMVGVSAEAGKLAYDKVAESANKAADINAYNVYYNGKWGAFDLVAEYYTGKNVGAGVTGGLALSSAVEPTDYDGKESGFYVSGKYMLSEAQGIFLGYGEAKLNREADAATSGAGPTFRNLASNTFTRLGYDYTVDAGVTFYGEAAMLTSGYYNGTSVDKTSGTFVDVGLIAKF